MNRRSTLKSLVTVSGALLTLPGWARSWNLQSIQSYVSSYSLAEQDTLSAVADTIIPAGDSIGALSVGVDKFLQKLFDRCYEKEMQDNIKVQLASLETKAQRLPGDCARAATFASRGCSGSPNAPRETWSATPRATRSTWATSPSS